MQMKYFESQNESQRNDFDLSHGMPQTGERRNAPLSQLRELMASPDA